jgi:hypothetical protein
MGRSEFVKPFHIGFIRVSRKPRRATWQFVAAID